MTLPKISIIVPVFNAEKYIHRCIDSLLAQSFTNFELILVDDGSSDRSGQICDEYAAKDSRVSVFHKKNEGVSSARNLGLDNAKGEWISFVDSDDFVYEHFLDNFDVNNNQCFDLINQGLRIDKEFSGSNEFKFSFVGDRNSWLNEATRNGTFGYCVIKLFKTQIIRNNNICFNTRVRFQEDELFVLSYLAACNLVKSVAKVGYFYFVPDWGKYLGGNIEDKLLRTNLMLQVLQDKFERPEELLIFHKKKNSLVRYYIEGNLAGFKYTYLKKLKELAKEGYGVQHMPKLITRLIAFDSIYLISIVQIISLKLYSWLTNRKIESI